MYFYKLFNKFFSYIKGSLLIFSRLKNKPFTLDNFFSQLRWLADFYSKRRAEDIAALAVAKAIAELIKIVPEIDQLSTWEKIQAMRNLIEVKRQMLEANSSLTAVRTSIMGSCCYTFKYTKLPKILSEYANACENLRYAQLWGENWEEALRQVEMIRDDLLQRDNVIWFGHIPVCLRLKKTEKTNVKE